MIGTEIGHYRIEQKIAEGGMGEIYRALDTRLGRQVVLKILRAPDPATAEPVIEEARAASAITHPNIATIHEAGYDPDHRVGYIVMEWVQGRNLRDLFRDRQVPMDEWLGIAEQISRGLGKAHKENIVHRDVKPENVMVSEDGFVKILDFGLSRIQMSSSEEPIGSPLYMAPERLRGEPGDARSDVYSVGVILYQMVSGHLPFEGSSADSWVRAALAGDRVPLAKRAPALPADVVGAVEKAMAFDPAERFPDADALGRAIRRLRGAPGPRRRRRRWVLVALLPVLIAGGAYLGFWPPPAPQEEPEERKRVTLPVRVAFGEWAGGTGAEDAALPGLMRYAMETNLRGVAGTFRIVEGAPEGKGMPDGAPQWVIDGTVTQPALLSLELELRQSQAPMGGERKEFVAKGFADVIDAATLWLFDRLGLAPPPPDEPFGVAAFLTTSRQALAAYLEGLAVFEKGDFRGAKGRFADASQGAEDFAAAHYGLYLAEWCATPFPASSDSIRKAHAWRVRGIASLRRKIEAFHAMAENGDHPRAMRIFTDVLSVDPGDLEARLGLVECLSRGFVTADFPAAIQEGEAFLRSRPAFLPLHRCLLYAYAYAGRFEDADRSLGALRSYEQEDAIRWWSARLAEIRGDREGFAQEVMNLVLLSKGPWVDLARLLVPLVRFDRVGERDLRFARRVAAEVSGEELPPAVALLLVDLDVYAGDIAGALGRLRALRWENRSSLAIDPSIRERAIGLIHLALGDREGAREWFRRGADRSRENPIPYLLLIAAGWDKDAPLDLDIAKGPAGSIAAHVGLWATSDDPGKKREALAALRKAAEAVQGYVAMDILPVLKWLNGQEQADGEPSGAIADLESLVNEPWGTRPRADAPLRVLARYDLGRACERGGEPAKARTWYSEFLSFWGEGLRLPEGMKPPACIEDARERIAAIDREAEAKKAGP